MSIAVMTWVWDHSINKGSELLLELTLADFAHDDGGSIYPAVPTLAKKVRLTERAVQYLLRKLEASGELLAEGKTEHGVTRYRIVMGVQTLHQGGDTHCTRGVKPIAPNPLLDPSIKKLTRVKSRIPKGFALSPEMKAYAMREGVALPEVEFRKFREYYEAKGSVWLDWEKVWQSWCRRNRESYANKNAAVSPYGPPKPRELVAPISQEQRLENVRRLRELTAGIGK